MHRSRRRSCSKLIVECWVTAEDADVHIWVKIPGLASEVFGEGRVVVQHCLILHKISLPLIKFEQYHSIWLWVWRRNLKKKDEENSHIAYLSHSLLFTSTVFKEEKGKSEVTICLRSSSNQYIPMSRKSSSSFNGELTDEQKDCWGGKEGPVLELGTPASC